MFYGKAEDETIDLSELTFFSGDDKTDNNRPGAPEAFRRMRGAAAVGDFAASQEAAKGVIGIRGNYGTNLPVGRLEIHTGKHREGNLVSYRRILNLMKGTAGMRYQDKTGSSKSTCFVSHPHRVLVYKLESDAVLAGVRIACRGMRETDETVYDGRDGSFICQARETMHSDGHSGVTLYGAFTVITDGQAQANADGIRIEGAKKVLIYLSMLTDFGRGEDKKACVSELHRRISDASALGYGRIRREHEQDVSQKMERNLFTLNGSDDGLMERMYQMGRYLLLASMREDSPLPAPLQGVWNDNVACRIGWTCDMHLNINTQMNCWPAELCNLSECTKPLFHWMKERLVPHGRAVARETYGFPGWVAENVSNAWGYAAPYWAVPLSPYPTGGVWILTHMWEHYRFTGDTDFLRQEAFPLIEEAVAFFNAYVFKDSTGRYTSGPAISPENSFVREGRIYYASCGATSEILLIRELFDIYVKACEVLGVEGTYLDAAREKRRFLLPYRVRPDGTIAEWAHDYPSADAQHRHSSHLLGLYPFAQITPDDPVLAAAAERTILKKITPAKSWEDTGWARALLMLYETRLLHPEEAWGHIGKMLAYLREPNDMIIHPPTRGAPAFDNVYELDGNTGLTACIAEMLLQSHRGYIHILPCIPKIWETGSVTGLVARGGIRVDIDWDRERVEVKLHADGHRSCLVRYCETKEPVMVDGEKVLTFLRCRTA